MQEPFERRHRPVVQRRVAFVGGRERTWTGKKPPKLAAVLLISSSVVRRIQFPHRRIRRSSSLNLYSCAFLVSPIHSSQFSFHRRYLAPSPAGRWCSSGISRVIGRFSGIRLWACASSRLALCSPCALRGRIAFLHLLRPCGADLHSFRTVSAALRFSKGLANLQSRKKADGALGVSARTA